MCEGPEVFALAQALQRQGVVALSHGTHIFFEHLAEDWGFTPRACHITLDDEGCLSTSNLQGIIRSPVDGVPELVAQNMLGVDWMHATTEDFSTTVLKWSKSRKPLGALLASQYDIAGIGSAWGSEVCHCAYVLPNEPANEQDLGLLPDALAKIRDTAAEAYQTSIGSSEEAPEVFIQEWPFNLKAERAEVMQVYGRGNPVGVYAYTWWV